jgi:hypothetical protein
MALVVFDRVQQTGSANTTVSFTLTGSVTGFQSFAVVGNGNTTFYAATDASGDWEVGVGTYSSTGPTLTRTTILSSSNSNSAVTFSGTVTVFVTYPSEKSVNLDASGNVSPLGTITSGVWNGTTIPVAYGGTGVTSSSGANSVVLRDANVNISANNVFQGYAATATSGGTTTLTAASAFYQRFTGTNTQTIKMPDATTLQKGVAYTFDNDSTQTITIIDNSSGAVDTIISGAVDLIILLDNSTVAGTWIGYSYIPDTYDFGTSTASFGNATITNTTYQGNAITSAYGGTGLTSFGAANYALYSTSSSLLTAGTLPTAAGGTGGTATPTAGGVPYGTGSAYAFTSAGTAGQVLTSNGSGAPTWQSSGTSSGTYTRTTYTATAGQTTFNVSYAPGYVQVYLNGLLLDTTDYTATDGNTVVLNTGASAGDLFVAIVFTISTTLAGTYTRTSATATSGQTVFYATYSAPYIQVFVNGVLLNAADYTATNGTSIILTVGATAGDIVETVSYYVASISATPPIAINSTEIASNTTINNGTNGFSVGPITIDAGVSVTVANGSRWVVI